MYRHLASALLLIAIVAAILPPGYPAYIGAYVALVAGLLALLTYGWRERATLRHPTALAILGAIVLVSASIPFVYHGPQDLVAPVLILPMLATIALGLAARPAGWIPGLALFATICLAAAGIALVGGGYERFALGIPRPGLGNNPIHYSSLAAFSGALALVGVVGSKRPWRYIFLLGPMLGIAATVIADSRGPLLGGLAMSSAGLILLTVWLWHEKLFRLTFLICAVLASAGAVYLLGSGNFRVASIFNSALNIFRFTGGTDDIRAALYTSGLEILKNSPLTGVGLGQIMLTAQALFPEQPEVWSLEHLHADWANFAAMAGGLGLLAWLLLLAAPLLLLWDSRVRRDRVTVLAAILLTTGQFVLGISNATFGILPQTTIYAVALGYFLARARRLAMAQ